VLLSMYWNKTCDDDDDDNEDDNMANSVTKSVCSVHTFFAVSHL